MQMTNRILRWPTYVGTGFYCPVCKRDSRRFKAAGDPPRKNAECPRCGARERHRLLMHFLDSEMNIGNFGRQLRILHIAPERMISLRLRKYGNVEYISGDINPGRGMVVVDVTNIPYQDEQFDVVICCHVLEHVNDHLTAMSELRRVLKSDGFAIIDAPVREELAETFEDWTITTPEGRRQAFGQWNHVRLYGRDYPELLRRASFNVAIDPISISEKHKRQFALDNGDRIYYCTRAPFEE